MIGPFSVIDVLFLVTIVFLIFNGLRNGAVFSLFNLLSLPLAFIITYLFGPQFTKLLATNGVSATPIISYVVLFFAVVLLLHIVGTIVRGVVRSLPLFGIADSLIGGLVGLAEAYLLWVILLIVLHNFLLNINHIPGIDPTQFTSWQQFYNDAVTNSLFAKVNSFVVTRVPISIHP